MSEVNSKLNVLAELERLGSHIEFVSEDEVRIRCPFHEDESPSCTVNVVKRVFMCRSAECRAKGDAVSLIAGITGRPRALVAEELSRRYGRKKASEAGPIAAETVEKFHQLLLGADALLKELRDRGVDLETIRRYRLGRDGARIVIPVYDEAGDCVNLRKYLPGAPSGEKMRSLKGRGQLRLYPIDQLKYETVFVCAGEVKALAVARLLNPLNIGAVSTTGGESAWDRKFTPLFTSKKVRVAYDVDDAGRLGAESLCRELRRSASEIRNLDLPLDRQRFPKGDVSDWIGQCGATAEMLLKLADDTQVWVDSSPRRAQSFDEDPTDVDLGHAASGDKATKRVRFKATVTMLDTSPYVVPKRVRCLCSRDEKSCGLCPIFEMPAKPDGVPLDIHPESEAIVAMVGFPKGAQRPAIMQAFGIPANCKSAAFEADEFHHVEDARLSPRLEISMRSASDISVPALHVARGPIDASSNGSPAKVRSLELNESYEMVGRCWPSPKTQQSVLVLSDSRTVDDALSTYDPTDEELEGLKIFQPGKWTVEAVDAKIAEICEDLSDKVTRIYDRRDMHEVVDLAFHSVLLFEFAGRVVKGWTEVLIIGDSAQGKSETTEQLMRHYGLGEKVECKGASEAGLLGGCKQEGNRWFVSWGIIPTHDKRLVFLEELKGASTEVIAKLTDMRSTGVAQITKIVKRKTHARTRLVACSNPRSGLPLSAYSFGIEAAKELIGNPEDLRRFDAVYFASAEDVSAETINSVRFDDGEPKFDSQSCRSLVLWAWTRRETQVQFESEELVMQRANELCSKFVDSVPIVDRGSMRLKLARLAAACACRTFSTVSRDLRRVLVRKCHVDYVARFLERIYSSRACGYLDFSEAVRVQTQLVDEPQIEKRVLATPFPRDLIDRMLATEKIEVRDLRDWCGYGYDEAEELTSFLVRKHALVRNERSYRKNPRFIELIRKLRDSDALRSLERCPHDETKEEF